MTTIIIDDPAVESAIEQAAADVGVPVQTLVHDVLAAQFANGSSMSRLNAVLAQIAATGVDAPAVPLDRLTREHIYE
jgi:dihydroxyacetone kinase